MSSTKTSANKSASEAPSWTEPPATLDEALSRVKALRPWIASLGAHYDATGADPADIMAALSASGVQAINVPVEFGGLLTHWQWGGVTPLIEAWHEIAAGDGSVGQMWGTGAFLSRVLLREEGLPKETRAQLAHEILHEGRRLANVVSERGMAGPSVARRVAGGIVIDGTKAFGTNTAGGGRDLASVSVLLVDDDDPTRKTPHAALIRMDAPGVEPAGDWNNMGQRATNSQTIRFRNTFVPDGWYYEARAPHPALLVTAMLGNASLIQGIGAGALDAAVDFLRGIDRASMPMFESAATDPVMHRRIGEMAARLNGARAFTLSVARRLDADPETLDFPELLVTALQTDVVATQAALQVTADLFDLTGARSTAASHGLDRFWRNARTSGSHHPRESVSAYIGSVLFNQTHPRLTDYIKF
ncbi:acyl-CoA dehydrogenase family protein [Streptomyces sp. LN785]|uniref:acyl-CoA dehydrogenase family protein n=1 Tax=Streptomyces sp. LN785 TaxID=3112983 RepID=UPI00371E151E